ncbi:MAG: PTS sugar transporter subunit IIA [Anaerolineaceae bacterium]
MDTTPILIVTHGNLGTAFVRSAQMLIGKRKDIETLGLKEGDGLTNFIDKVSQLISKYSEAKSILVFVDLRGGTPWNAVLATGDPRIQLISGVNLPILLEVLIKRDSVSDIDELVKCALEAASISVTNVHL